MPYSSALPIIVDALARLAHVLHLAFEHIYADAHALYARADGGFHDGDRAGYARLMQKHARLLAYLADLDAV